MTFVDQAAFIEFNRELSAQWPQLRKRKAALPDADRWKHVPGKRAHLER
jgi:ferredoxin